MPHLVDPPGSAASLRKRWNREEYAAMDSLGLLGQGRYELVEGDLLDRADTPAHDRSVELLRGWLVSVFGSERVKMGIPIDIAPKDNRRNRLQPDLIVLNRDPDFPPGSNPGPADLHLVVEVADLYVWFDYALKGGLYLRARIADYWVLDVSGRRMIVSRQPLEGRYGSLLVYSPEETLAPLAAPEALLRIGDALPE